MAAMLSLRATAAASILLVTAVACANDDDDRPEEPASSSVSSPTSSPESSSASTDASCLVTAAELAEITGTEQTIESSSIPSGDLYCETPEDSRGVEIEWFVLKPSPGRPLSHEKQGSNLKKTGLTVSEVELGSDATGWLGTGPLDVAAVQVLTLVDGRELHVNAQAASDDDNIQDHLADDAVGIARAFVAASAD